MSDRIRYAVGNTSNRDCVNWPTILRSEIDSLFGVMTEDERDVHWPVEITKAQIMALAWRVKKWRFSGSAEVTINYHDPGIDQTVIATATSEVDDTDVYHLIDGGNIATRESDLVKRVFDTRYRALVSEGIGAPAGAAPVSNWETNGTEEIGGGGASPFTESGSTPASGFGQLEMGISAGFVLFESGDLFSPGFGGIGNVVPESIGISRLGLSVTFDKNPETILSGTGPLLLKAPGTLTINPGIVPSFDVPLELAWRLIGEASGSSVSGTGEAEFFLEAAEFWSYENSLGQPVWDSATGAQINDPFG